MGTSAASEPPYFFIIVTYDLWPTCAYSFLLLPIGNSRTDHFTDLLHDFTRYLIDMTHIEKNMWLSWQKISISVQSDWLWSPGKGRVNYKRHFSENRKICMYENIRVPPPTPGIGPRLGPNKTTLPADLFLCIARQFFRVQKICFGAYVLM